MKQPFRCAIMKSGVLFLGVLFFQTALLSVSEAGESKPFYKSWLIERGYTHPGLRLQSKSSTIKRMAQPTAPTTAKAKSPRFWKSWLQEHSYAHPGITSSAAVSIPVKNIAKTAPASGQKRSTPKYRSRPEFNVCNFVCLSTCKSCNTNSSNYLMSRE